MYQIRRTETLVPVREIVKQDIHADKYIEYCRQCPNFGIKWSCPPYDFDVSSVWCRYADLNLIAVQIYFDEALLRKTYSEQELNHIQNRCIEEVRIELDCELLAMEQTTPGSLALYPGSCLLCDSCSRTREMKCAHPNQMRFSIESLGGDVSALTEKYFGIELKWAKSGTLPEYLTLVCGLLCEKNHG